MSILINGLIIVILLAHSDFEDLGLSKTEEEAIGGHVVLQEEKVGFR